MQAGHGIPKALGMSLYFDEKNVHCQCYRCNINLDGNGVIYAKRIIENYGSEEMERLLRQKNEIKKYTIAEYQQLIEEYTDKCIGLETKRGLR